jgi:acyl-CoA reductase-like NAD-dependent aldehyde dehydrogenase
VDAESPQGRLIGADAAARVRSILDDAVELGARLIRGGKVEGDRISAAVVDEVSPRMRLYSEEVFGPVLGIVRVRDRDEALTIANDTEYGLVASIFSADIAAATEMLW